MASHTRLYSELISFLRQHSAFADQRHLVLLAQMVAGLLLSQTVCFDRWKTVLPLGHCLEASWQRRCQRWLSNSRIDVEALYGSLILWALQQWEKPGQALHLALDTTMLWNRCCVVVLSVVAHGRAIPLLWQTLEHPSVSVSFWTDLRASGCCRYGPGLPRGSLAAPLLSPQVIKPPGAPP